MKVLHHFGDPLWALGNKSTPDPSFTIARVFPQEVSHATGLRTVVFKKPQSCLRPPRAAADLCPLALQVSSSIAEGNSDDAAAQLGSMSVDDAAKARQVSEQQPVTSSDDSVAAVVDTEQQDSRQAEAAAPVPTDPDGVVEHCLLVGLLAVTDEELPIMLSDFYSKHMLANKPDGASHAWPHSHSLHWYQSSVAGNIQACNSWNSPCRCSRIMCIKIALQGISWTLLDSMAAILVLDASNVNMSKANKKQILQCRR